MKNRIERVEETQMNKEAALLARIEDFLDFAWDKGLSEARRNLTVMCEGFISSEFCESIGHLDRGNSFGMWVKIMELLDAMEDYRSGRETVRIVMDHKNL